MPHVNPASRAEVLGSMRLRVGAVLQDLGLLQAALRGCSDLQALDPESLRVLGHRLLETAKLLRDLADYQEHSDEPFPKQSRSDSLEDSEP